MYVLDLYEYPYLLLLLERVVAEWLTRRISDSNQRYLAFKTSGLPYSASLSACSSTLLIT